MGSIPKKMAASATAPCQQNTNIFSEAVRRILKSWTALQLAVEHSFGGPESTEKAEWLVYAIDTWFKENANIETYEMEDFLEEVLNTEFDLRVEDNSIQQVANMICLYYRLSQENRVDDILKRLELLPKASSSQNSERDTRRYDFDTTDDEGPYQAPPRASQNTSASNETGEDMEEDNADAEEEDGWNVIRRGRKKR